MLRTIQLEQIALKPTKVQNNEKTANVTSSLVTAVDVWSLIEKNDLLYASLNVNNLLASISVIIVG